MSEIYKKLARKCPRCKKTTEPNMVYDRKMFDYSWCWLDLPFYLCGECRVAFLDKALVRKTVSDWRNDTNAHKYISYKKALQKSFEILRSVLLHYTKNLGYKIIRFK